MTNQILLTLLKITFAVNAKLGVMGLNLTWLSRWAPTVATMRPKRRTTHRDILVAILVRTQMSGRDFPRPSLLR